MKFCRAKSPLSVYIAYVLVVKINTEESEINDVSERCVWLCLPVRRSATSLRAWRRHSCHLLVCHLPTCRVRAGKTGGKKSENSFVG